MIFLRALTFGHVSLASVNIFWIGVAENDATVRGVHFRNVLAIETLFYFRNFAKTLSIINRKQEFATLLGILSRLVHVCFHTPGTRTSPAGAGGAPGEQEI